MGDHPPAATGRDVGPPGREPGWSARDDGWPGREVGRSARGRCAALLRRRVGRHPLYVWLLWAGAVAVLAVGPLVLSDPALWPLLLDPELIALIAVTGLQYACTEVGLLWVRARPGPRRRR